MRSSLAGMRLPAFVVFELRRIRGGASTDGKSLRRPSHRQPDPRFRQGDYRAGAVRSQRLTSSRSVSDALQSSPGGAWAYRLGGIELVIGQKNAPLAGAREALQSGWRDLNPRPPRPERGALPGCATPRRCTRCQHKAYGSGRRAEEYGTEERVVRVEAVKLPRSEDGSRGPWIGHDSFRNERKLFSRSREWCVRCATSTVSSAHIMNARVIA